MTENDTQRDFAPDARYAANAVPGVRWHDERTGQEQWSRPVGVDTLLDAGASLNDPAEVELASGVKIGPNKMHGGWTVTISQDRLNVHDEGDVVRLVGTQTYAGPESFDGREDAVAWAEGEVDAYADAEVKDAVEWRETRRAEREKEQEEPTEDTTEQETLA